MSAEEFTSLFAEVAFVLLAILTVVRAIRRPRLVKIHTAVFFSMIGAIVLLSWLGDLEILGESRARSITVTSLLVALPYPLLRLAGDFTGVRPWVRHAAEIALALSIAGIGLFEELPGWFVILVVAYFVATTTYASAEFTHAALTMRSVSRFRMVFAAGGSFILALLILDIGVQAFVESPVLTALTNLLMVACGFSYYVAFAIPQWVRQAIHARHLLRFIDESVAAAPGMFEDDARFEAIEHAVADAVGTPNARIALWDEADDILWSPTLGGAESLLGNPRTTVPYRAFREQVAIFSEDAGRDDPENASLYGGMVVLTAPITLDAHRYGVLTAYGGLPPFIHDDDLDLLRIMADQVAVVLRGRELAAEVSAVRARAETLRLMDDFFAAVAHDLKTPLTTILGQGQRLQRQIRREQPIDGGAIDSIVQQAVHMRRLVEDLLDDARERGSYSGERVPTDLRQIAAEVAQQAPAANHTVTVEGGPAVAPVDAARMRQVLTNLVENAVKYSPDGGPITITVTDAGDCAEVAVTDRGIGIPPGDLGTIFERFSRGSREPDRRFSGLGLGLYTCRRIVEEHGGRIEVTSRLGAGSTFTVSVPVTPGVMVSGEAGYAETGAGD